MLLFVHGNPTWSFHWREMIRALSDRYRCIAVDHLGCGQSERPAGWSYRLHDHIDNLSALAEQLDLQSVALVAQDWGGSIGLGAALAAPERFSRFVLFNTGAFRPWFIPWRIRLCRIPLLGRLAVQGANLFLQAAFRMALADRHRLSPTAREGYLAPYGDWSSREAIYRFVQDIPASPSHPTYRTLAEIEDRLSSLGHLPWLLVWGMRDWCFTPACLDKFIELVPTAEVHRLTDVGHWIVEEAPDRVIPIVERFLAQSPAADSTTTDIASSARHAN